MKWYIVFAATFLILSNVSSLRTRRDRWHREWDIESNNDDFPKDEDSFSGDFPPYESIISSGKSDYDEFFHNHNHHHHHHHHHHHDFHHNNNCDHREHRNDNSISTTTEFEDIKQTNKITTRDIQDCILTCLDTSQYDPVCGTNMVTYTNLGRLVCAKNCGLDVDVLSFSSCSQNGPQNVITTTIRSTTDRISIETSPETLVQQECIRSCQSTTKQLGFCESKTERRPVCGTDIVTYDNPEHLLCAQFCGIDVRLKQFSACADVNSKVTLTTTPKTIETFTESTSAVPPNSESCLVACPVSLEYNPVCGTNDVTYKNPSVLHCHELCGADVQIKHISSCLSLVTTTAAPLPTTTTLAPNINLCIKYCPALSGDEPICGTNGVTYKNPSYLQCAKTCGVKVEWKHRSPCPEALSTANGGDTITTNNLQSSTAAPSNQFNQEQCIDNCQKSSEYFPVCGSNNVTYNNIDHLKCAISCNVDVNLDTFSPCTKYTIITSSTTDVTDKVYQSTSTIKVPENTNDPNANTTINPNMFYSIFTTPSTTTEESSEDYIDPRFGENG